MAKKKANDGAREGKKTADDFIGSPIRPLDEALAVARAVEDPSAPLLHDRIIIRAAYRARGCNMNGDAFSGAVRLCDLTGKAEASADAIKRKIRDTVSAKESDYRKLLEERSLSLGGMNISVFGRPGSSRAQTKADAYASVGLGTDNASRLQSVPQQVIREETEAEGKLYANQQLLLRYIQGEFIDQRWFGGTNEMRKVFGPNIRGTAFFSAFRTVDPVVIQRRGFTSSNSEDAVESAAAGKNQNRFMRETVEDALYSGTVIITPRPGDYAHGQMTEADLAIMVESLIDWPTVTRSTSRSDVVCHSVVVMRLPKGHRCRDFEIRAEKALTFSRSGEDYEATINHKILENSGIILTPVILNGLDVEAK